MQQKHQQQQQQKRKGQEDEQGEKTQNGNGWVPAGRDGREKGRPLGEGREERKKKRAERGKHNEDETAEEDNSSVPEW